MNNYRLIYIITILSGAAGLIYQITWTRILIVVFGASSHSTVAVISAFLGGIAIGSFFIGKWADGKDPQRLIKTYFLIEIGIAISAVATIFALPNLHLVYANFSDGTDLSSGLLVIKFVLTAICLLIPTILMGATIPVLVSILKNKLQGLDNSISILYSLNTLGAVLGVLATAFIMIELFGIKESILIGAGLNILAGLLILNLRIKRDLSQVASNTKKLIFSEKERAVLACLFATGFITIGYEVLWARVLTPSAGTYIYAFALVLAIYLFGIFLGALIYNKFLQHKKGSAWFFSISQTGIALFAIFSVLAVIQPYLQVYLTYGCIFVASFFMGISFPAGNFLLRNKLHEGRIAGITYFLNTIGCILGGIFTVFILIPLAGSIPAILIFSICNLILALFLLFLAAKKSKIFFKPYLIVLGILTIFCLYLIFFRSASLFETETAKLLNFFEENGAEVVYKEDDLASVIGFNNKDSAAVFVNTEGMTGLVLETRLMAHLPIAIHPNPKKFLAICLGIGSTYRSARLHGLDVDAVELSTTVASLLSFFYEDVDRLPGKGRVIVNDGRNYINLTDEKYDIITVDPPPPLNSAGTTVLYSEDFYRSMINNLNKNGIVMEWLLSGDREDDILMTKKSFLNVFPYAFALRWGEKENEAVFMFGSMSPIKIDKKRINQIMSSAVVRDDIIRFHETFNMEEFENSMLTREDLIEETKNVKSVTDNNPLTEYFLLRYLFSKKEL